MSGKIGELVEEARHALADAEMARDAIALVDLTSLTGDESDQTIAGICASARHHGTAAVCLHATHVGAARRHLAGSDVRVATVCNFPHGGSDILATAEEARAAVAAGAQEIDVVVPLEAIFEGDVGLVGDLVCAVREVCGAERTLKVILETGRLEDPDLITSVARAAVMEGADFLKTSTGRYQVGATLEAAALLLTVCADSGGRVGFKAAGGIRTAGDAATYLWLARAIMGEGWIAPTRFRFGASSLLDDLVRVAANAPAARPEPGQGY